MRAIKASLIFIAISFGLQGCAAIETVAVLANSAMEITGLKKAEVPDAQKLPRDVTFDIIASEHLNTTTKGESLALVTKIYKLKQHETFDQATYETFLDSESEKQVLGPDLIEVKEVVLVPEQHYVVTEKVPAEAPYIGVVALFRSPNAKHWRSTFSSVSAEKLGISLRMLSCVMLVNSGDVQTLERNKALSVNRCY